MADLLGMNLSPPPGLVLPSLPGIDSLEGDLLFLLVGLFLPEVTIADRDPIIKQMLSIFI